MEEINIMFIIMCFAVGTVCGYIAKSIGEHKGIKGSFWWGFLLGIIGVIIVAVMPTNSGNADEIKKYKELLDNGIITSEQFEKKKKQLLNL